MREYETVFITQPNLTDPQLKQVKERFASVIEKNSGRLFYARDMGKRQLAYPIKKELKGIYTCLDYAANGPAVAEIERIMRLDENVLRFLSVVKNENVDVEARAAEIVAKGEDAQPQAAEEAGVPALGAPFDPDAADESSDDMGAGEDK